MSPVPCPSPAAPKPDRPRLGFILQRCSRCSFRFPLFRGILSANERGGRRGREEEASSAPRSQTSESLAPGKGHSTPVSSVRPSHRCHLWGSLPECPPVCKSRHLTAERCHRNVKTKMRNQSSRGGGQFHALPPGLVKTQKMCLRCLMP